MSLQVKVAGGGGKPYYSGTQEKATAIAGDLIGRGYVVTINESSHKLSGLEVRVTNDEVVFSEFGPRRNDWERTVRNLLSKERHTPT